MTCYKPGRSKTLFFGLNLKGAKFLEALNLWVRCRRRLFFSTKKGPHIFGSPELVGTLPQAPFFSTKKGPIFLGTDPPDLGTDHEGTARKYLARHGIMRARHGNIWHGTDPPDLGTARHGTSLGHRTLTCQSSRRSPQSTWQGGFTYGASTGERRLKAQRLSLIGDWCQLT